MIPRIVIPANISLKDSAPQAPSSIQKAHLVTRRLIPANAKLSPLPETGSSPEGAAPSTHKPMVGKLLVPAGARMANAADQSLPSGDPQHPHGGAPHQPHKLFDEAILNKGALGHKRGAAEWTLSFAVHAAIIAALVIAPLYFTQAINPQQLELTYLVAPPMPSAPPPPPPPAAALAPRPTPTKVVPVTEKLTMPIAIPKNVPQQAQTEVAEAPPDITGGVAGGVLGGVPGGQVGGVLGGVAGGIAGGTGMAAAPPPPPAAAPSGPLQVGGQVKPPHVIFAPQPEYPILAKQARIQGDVEIDAVIDEHGNVVKEHAVSGSGVLVPAALEAVSQWKYEPTYLNGKPYPVELAVDVTFRL